MTTEQLNELRRLLAEATPGRWEHCTFSQYGNAIVTAELMHSKCICQRGQQNDSNMRLIAAAVNVLPELLDIADDCERYRLKTLAQDAEIAKLREALRQFGMVTLQRARTALAEGGAA